MFAIKKTLHSRQSSHTETLCKFYYMVDAVDALNACMASLKATRIDDDSFVADEDGCKAYYSVTDIR